MSHALADDQVADEHFEWAVQCSCGELLQQPSEEAARQAHGLWNERSWHGGNARLLHRRVIVGEWEKINAEAGH